MGWRWLLVQHLLNGGQDVIRGRKVCIEKGSCFDRHAGIGDSVQGTSFDAVINVERNALGDAFIEAEQKIVQVVWVNVVEEV